MQLKNFSYKVRTFHDMDIPKEQLSYMTKATKYKLFYKNYTFNIQKFNYQSHIYT